MRATPDRPRCGPPRSSTQTSPGTTRSAGVEELATPVYQDLPTRGFRANWRKVGAGVGVSAQTAVIYVRPVLVIGEVLVIVNATIPLITVLITFGAAIWGSQDTCDRVYRLMRMVANRSGPPAPPLSLRQETIRPICKQPSSSSRRGNTRRRRKPLCRR